MGVTDITSIKNTLNVSLLQIFYNYMTVLHLYIHQYILTDLAMAGFNLNLALGGL